MILSLVSKCSSHLLPPPFPPPPRGSLPPTPARTWFTTLGGLGWLRFFFFSLPLFYITFLHLVLGRRNLVARGDGRFTAAAFEPAGGKSFPQLGAPQVEASQRVGFKGGGVKEEEKERSRAGGGGEMSAREGDFPRSDRRRARANRFPPSGARSCA